MRYSSTDGPVDLVGIGIGPANLSLAALLKRHPRVRARFFERRAQFQWHAGLMLPNASLQVPFLKDLVSLVDPTSELSSLQFLATHKRLLCFINANFPQVLRREFNQYYRWACEQLDSLEFGREVEAVELDGETLTVRGNGWSQPTRSIVLGTGLQAAVPDCAKPWLGATLLHASQYLINNNPVEGKRVVVIGGMPSPSAAACPSSTIPPMEIRCLGLTRACRAYSWRRGCRDMASSSPRRSVVRSLAGSRRVQFVRGCPRSTWRVCWRDGCDQF